MAVYGLLGVPAPERPVVNQDRDDVTVVRAATTPLVLDTTTCQPIDAASVDCTDALAQAANAPGFHRIIFAAGQTVSGCSLLRITTASKATGLASAFGIGFWSAQAAGGNQTAENSGLFVEKGQLRATGTATLLSGAPATLHEFVGVANCPASGSEPLSRLFKPYMHFEGADGKTYRNWDLAPNYRISRDAPQFDRSADVLRP